MSKIMFPGDSFPGGKIPYSGAVLSRQNGLKLPVIETGRGLQFVPMRAPGPWLAGMLGQLDHLATSNRFDPEDYTLVLPFQIHQGVFEITNSIITTHQNQIGFVPKCAMRVTNDMIPISSPNGKVVMEQKQVLIISTFNEDTLFLVKNPAQVMLAFEVSAEVDKKFQGITPEALVREAQAINATAEYRIGGRAIFPKARPKSTMMPKLFKTLFDELNIQTTPKSQIWWVSIH